MSLVEKIDQAFLEVSEAFPFPGYMQPYCYFQLRAIIEELSRHLPCFEGRSLLDVGSGPMDKTAVFQRIGFRTYAVDDLSDPWHKLPGNVSKILAFGKAQEICFHLQEENHYSIPFETASFDIVTSIAVIEHLHDSPRHILNLMGEYLRDGGLLVIAMPNAVNLRKRLSVLCGRTNYNPVDEMFYAIDQYRGHVREYTLKETAYICERAGFEIISSKHFEHLAYTKVPRIVRPIYLSLVSLVPSLKTGVLVIARKPSGWKPLGMESASYWKAIAASTPSAVVGPAVGHAAADLTE